jgi:hypothetical protein
MEKVQVQPEFNVANEMNDLLKKKIETEFIPFTPPNKWYGMAYRALKYLNLLQAGIRVAELKKIVTKYSNYGNTEQLTMMEFAVLSNNLESRTAEELLLTIEEFIEIMEMADSCSTQWNERLQVMKTEVKEEVKAKMTAAGEQQQPVGKIRTMGEA